MLARRLLRLGVRDPLAARARLEQQGFSVRDGAETTLLVEARGPEDAAAVNAVLVHDGQAVFHLAFERSSLERLFFEATRQAEARPS
jgi:hypothetical protein